MSATTPQIASTRHAADAVRPASFPAAGVAGLLSVVCMVIAFAMVPADPGGSAADDIASRYADGADGYLKVAVLESASAALLVVLLAGMALRLSSRARGPLAAAVTAGGGAVLVTCQLVGYGLIAVLALGTAERGDPSTVMAFYDASAVAFVVSSTGLALVGLATGWLLLQRPDRRVVLGSISALTGLAGAVGASALAADGALSPHGDVSFLVLLVQLVWTLAVALWMLRPDAAAAA